jgi:hypothetical protein
MFGIIWAIVRTFLTALRKRRAVQRKPSASAKVVALPRVGGLHHRYEWRDAA